MPPWWALARTTRLALVAVTFYALVKAGGFLAVGAGLLGLSAARVYLIRSIRSTTNGR